mgnify:CR=1 FL=1
MLDDPNNNWTRFIKRILFDVDSGVLDKFVPVFMNIALNSYSLRTQAIEKYHCNIPWAILIDPTAACNLHCKGCWAAEYGKESTLGFETLSRVVKEGKAVGTLCIFSPAASLWYAKRISSACVRRIRTVSFFAFDKETHMRVKRNERGGYGDDGRYFEENAIHDLIEYRDHLFSC